MNDSNDWKDALASLRGSLDQSEDNEAEELTDEKVADSLSGQKTPLHIVIDKKGRNGKVATIIEGFTVAQEEVEKISKELKKTLGVGGSVREGEILIQGNHIEAVKKILTNLNFKIK